MLTLLLLLACGDPPAPVDVATKPGAAPAAPQPPGPPGRTSQGPAPPGAGKASMMARPYSVAGVAAEALVLRWSTERRPELLVEALTALEDARVEMTFDHHLRAWITRLQGDTDAEAKALAAADPKREAIYRYFFERPEAEVVALLRAHAHAICTMDRRPDCGAVPPVPADYPVFEQVAWVSHGANRLEQWVAFQRKPSTDDLFGVFGVQPGARVADIGAGEGWFTLPLARAVGPTGRVYATEIDPSYLKFIAYAAQREGLANVETVLQSYTDVSLPAGSVDLVLLCEVYKALTNNVRARDPAYVAEHVTPVLASIAEALVPGGRFVVIDHDAPETEDKAVSLSVVRTQVEAAGFRFLKRDDSFGPMQAILVFERE